jgi:hypothetical protein
LGGFQHRDGFGGAGLADEEEAVGEAGGLFEGVVAFEGGLEIAFGFFGVAEGFVRLAERGFSAGFQRIGLQGLAQGRQGVGIEVSGVAGAAEVVAGVGEAWVQFAGAAEGGDGGAVVFQLGVGGAEDLPVLRVAGVQAGGAFEVGDGLGGLVPFKEGDTLPVGLGGLGWSEEEEQQGQQSFEFTPCGARQWDPGGRRGWRG